MGLQWFISLCLLNFFSLVVVSMLILFYLRKRERLADKAAEKLFKEEEARLNTILDEVANISTALYGDIETRQKELQSALQEAERKIFELKQLANIHSSVEPRYSAASPRDTEHAETHAEEANPKTITRTPLNQEHSALYERIYGLADDGRSILEIAKTVNKPKGEVELILNLRHVSRSVS